MPRNPFWETFAKRALLLHRIAVEIGGVAAAPLVEYVSDLLRCGRRDALKEKSGDIDLYVIRGEADAPPMPETPVLSRPVVWGNYLATVAVVIVPR